MGNLPAYSTTGVSTACTPQRVSRGSGGLASMGRQAAGPADWGWVMGRRA